LRSTLTSGATTISHRFQAAAPECNTGLCCVRTIVGVRLKRHMSTDPIEFFGLQKTKPGYNAASASRRFSPGHRLTEKLCHSVGRRWLSLVLGAAPLSSPGERTFSSKDKQAACP
jgi:hypothetical protein